MLIKRKSIEAESNLRGGPKAAATRPARRKPRFAPITLSESNGIRYLHFGTEWVQGAMRVRKPDWLELEYSQQMMAWMLFQEAPARIAQLGLGSAARNDNGRCRVFALQPPNCLARLAHGLGRHRAGVDDDGVFQAGFVSPCFHRLGFIGV